MGDTPLQPQPELTQTSRGLDVHVNRDLEGKGVAQSDSTPEVVNKRPKVLVLGTRRSGIIEFADLMSEYSRAHKGPDIDVELLRNVTHIDAALEGRDTDNPDVEHESPVGVVVFPTMRFWTESGMGMDVETPVAHIEERCREAGIPYVIFNDVSTDREITTGTLELLSTPPSSS